MIADLQNLLSELSIGEPIACRRVRIIPLSLQRRTELEYLTLDDSTSETPIMVEEASASGSVPELRVRNRAKCRVFIPEGSTLLIGAKQNRVVNLSVMLAPESVTIIPVSCVERGRWRFLAQHFTPSYFADTPLRAMMCAGATASLKRTVGVHIDQGTVWNHVEAMLGDAKAASPTHAYHALYEKWHEDLADYKAQLRVPENACGVAVEIDGVLEAVDLFEKPSTLQKLWPRLVNSYTLAALRPEAPQGRKADVKEFLEGVLSSTGESYDPVGVGTTIRLTNAEAVGAALVCESHLVHLSLFANGTAKQHEDVTPVRQAQSNQLESRPEQEERRQPWWKFWV